MLVFLLVLIAATYVVNSVNGFDISANQNKDDFNRLSEYKLALIGFALNHVNTGERPGDLVLPDRLIETPVNYDGGADSCVTSGSGASTMTYCLGRLPWQTLGLSIKSPTDTDVAGRMPWYAVSANLIDPTCLGYLNPGILSLSYHGYDCAQGALGNVLPHPWLTVRDSLGNVLSNRVAFVIILPGKVLNGQARSESALSNASQYMDSITVASPCQSGVTCLPGTYRNDDNDNDFIIGNDGSHVTSTDANYGHPYYFNDKLVYVTIDDLMVEVAKRAAGDVSTSLISYRSKATRFPYAAPLGTPGTSSGTSNSGMLPIDVTDNCTCSSATSCSCAFGALTNTAFTRNSSTWSSSTGFCTRTNSNKTCTCTPTGALTGSCTRTTRTFSCNSNTGTCSLNGSVAGSYIFTVPSSYADIYSATTNCTANAAKTTATCTGSGSFSIGLKESTWFKNNKWQDYFYYRWSSLNDLQVGAQTGISALLINAGPQITTSPFAVKGSAQVRSSPFSINDYLDSTENINNDNIFDGTQMTRSSSYNDQSFIVYP